MKYAKIIDMCKKEKRLTIFTDKGQQWISDGYAFYPLLGLPEFNEETIAAVYDLPKSVTVKMEWSLPVSYCFDDVDRAENQVFYEKIQLPLGDGIVSIRTQEGVTFINGKYIKPIEDDAEEGTMGLYERVAPDGSVYIAVKIGWRLCGIIMPIRNVVKQDYLDDLKQLTSRMQAMIEQ